MKKYLTAGGLILASFVYALFQQGNGASAGLVAVPAPATGTATDTAIGLGQNGPPFATTTQAGKSSSSKSSSSSDTPPITRGTSGSGSVATGQYKDGSYTGQPQNAYYGYVQVRAIVTGGRLASIQILEYPNDRSTSRYINGQALPYLMREAVSAQNANVDTVSGASDTSAAFRESLGSALAQAKA